ncbi:hypothetical protein PTTG_10480 [Puccinia triticina 1-1 BBBD Race 1]|uniref:Uncharacterized protein n=1 Tax=Puccinia triticina (isolate 1-1 / race 1 (BBBD)) TaxID=630390 RepID=A0A180FZY8_PUCT1|nr:hypothetical protein PTTG_10480 [Puccinia triticina 1-1 BBBD Race 1]
MIYNLIVMAVAVGLVIVEKDTVAGRTIKARSAGPGRVANGGRFHLARRSHQAIERRGTLPAGLQPLFFVSATNTVYGGYSSKPLQLADRKSSSGLKISIGSWEFYTKDLNSYIQDRLTANNYGIYGFAASFNTATRSSDYSFFKSISTDQNSLSQKGLSARESHSHKSRSLQLAHLINKRQDDQVQCRNQRGESFLFSKNACSLAAAKMVSEKTAMSSCGNCQLVMIGPAGQLSSSNMPAADIQTHTSNILTGCVMGQRTDSPNIAAKSFSNSIPENTKPNYVLLLVKGLGESCDEYKK